MHDSRPHAFSRVNAAVAVTVTVTATAVSTLYLSFITDRYSNEFVTDRDLSAGPAHSAHHLMMPLGLVKAH